MPPRKKQSWERLDIESEQEFKAFRTYLQLGTGGRSLSKVVDALGVDPQTLSRMKSNRSWSKRCREYDDHRNQIDEDIRTEVLKDVLKKEENDVLDMNKRQSAIATALLGKVYEAVQGTENLTPSEAVKWFEAAARIERLSKTDIRDELRKSDEENNSTSGVLAMPLGQSVEDFMSKQGISIEVVEETEETTLD